MKNRTLSYFLIMLLILPALIVACSSDDEDDDSGASDSPNAPLSEQYSAEQPLNVLRLDSYHPEFLWSVQINAGVERAFAEQGLSADAGNLQIDYFYMDTKRQTDTEHFDAIAQQAAAYIEDTQPDIVIVSDNNAVRLVLDVINAGAIPFIFCGINDSPTNYGLVNHDSATGVLERAHIAETFDWIARVFGDEVRLALMFDDSITTNAYLRDVNQALAASPYSDAPVTLVSAFEDWQAQVMAANESSDVLVIGTYHTLRDADDNPVHEDTVMQWTVENSTIPIVPFWEFSIPFGALGGAVISGENQGYEAAQLAMQVMSGTPISELDIVTPPEGKLIINEAAVARWNVAIPDDLRAESVSYTPES